MSLHETILEVFGYRDIYRKYFPTEVTQRLNNLQAEWNIWSVVAPQALEAAKAAGNTTLATQLETHIQTQSAVGLTQAQYFTELAKKLTADNGANYVTEMQTFNTVKYPQFAREADLALVEYKNITGTDLKGELDKYKWKTPWTFWSYALLVGGVAGGVWLFKTFFYTPPRRSVYTGGRRPRALPPHQY